MKLLNRLFNRSGNTHNQNEEHAVIVHFDYLKNDLTPLYTLRNRLEETISRENVGEYDGHEIAGDYSDGFLYMYGPNAENLFKAIKPILEETDFTKGASVRLIFGALGSEAKEIEVEIINQKKSIKYK